jgi:hypothetical protein
MEAINKVPIKYDNNILQITDLSEHGEYKRATRYIIPLLVFCPDAKHMQYKTICISEDKL